MQRVDRLVHSACGLGRVLGDEVGHVVERKRLGVDGLDRESWRSRLIRSRSSTMARRWT